MKTLQSAIRDPRSAIIFIFALAVFLRILPGERMIDDAYITFRYACNIINGLGFVYNPGQRVLGTTTPLYTLLIAGLSFVLRTQNFPPVALWVNALADGLTCVLLVPLGETISGHRRVGIAAALLYAVAAFSVTFAIGGMETSVFVLLLVVTAFLYLRGSGLNPRPGVAVENRTDIAVTGTAREKHANRSYGQWWPLTAAFALLTRPDAIIFIGPIALDFAIRWSFAFRNSPLATRRSLLRFGLLEFGIFVAPLLLWLLFATFYFGSPLPHSIAAKVAAYRLAPGEGFIRLLQHYATPFFEQLTFPITPILLAFLTAYVSLTIIGLLAAFRRDSRSLCIFSYPALYFATFAVANPLIFRWYLTPPLPFYFLCILGGIWQIADSISRIATSRRKSQPADSHAPTLPHAPTPPHTHALFTISFFLFFVFSLRAWTLTPDHGPQRPAPEMAWFKLEQLYTQVGNELAPEVTPQTVIAAGDIGALGYLSGARILDTLGLISPQSTRYYPLPPDQLIINYAISADLIADYKPDYVVFLEVYGRRTLLVDPRFLAAYTLRQKIPTDIYGSDGMLVFKRR